MRSASNQSQRLFALDVLRGVAILFVLFRHTPDAGKWSGDLGSIGELALGALRRVGWVGVDLFFVLSGFLISGLLYKEFDRAGRIDLGRFWLRRGFKIWPSYFVAYGVVELCRWWQAATTTGQIPWQRIQKALPNFAFVQNYFPPSHRWPHSWSLAIEEHFYLLLPLLMLVVARMMRRTHPSGATDPFRALTYCGAALAIGCLLLRLSLALGGGTWEDAYYPTHCRVDGLFFGVLVGYLNRYHGSMLASVVHYWPLLLGILFAALIVPLLWPIESSPFTWSVGFTLLYLGFGGLVAIAAVKPALGSQGPYMMAAPCQVLRFLGIYSYTIYLAHSVADSFPGTAALRRLANNWLGEGLATERVVYWTLSVAGGVVLSHVVERVALRWRDRVLPSHTANAILSPPQRDLVLTPPTAPSCIAQGDQALGQ